MQVSNTLGHHSCKKPAEARINKSHNILLALIFFIAVSDNSASFRWVGGRADLG